MSSEKKIFMPRESGKFIAQFSKTVSVKNDGIEKFASEVKKKLKNHEIGIKNFSNSNYHPDSNDPKAADWLLVSATLNFCFWSDDNNLSWRVNGESGYFALCTAIKRAIEAGIPILDAFYISKITHDELQNILQGDKDSGEIPLFDERLKNLHNVGQVLLEKYNGTFSECIKSCNNSAQKLLMTIVEDFECFRDEAVYRNQKVSFYKRAQILVGDIWACFQGESLGSFYDIEYITMFADYRVPQVLVHIGAMEYSQSLLDKLLSGTNLQPGCIEEIEIRGCSIEAVEKIVEKVKKLINEFPSLELKESDCNSILIDYFLWNYRRQHAKELNHIPYHKVRTIYY